MFLLSNKTDKRILLLGVLIGAAVFLGSFLITQFSLAADDNANESRCVNYVGDCDNNQTSCSYFGFDWVTDGYPGGAGNPSCCGDDSQETVPTNDVGPNLDSSVWSAKITQVCCSVYEGTCGIDNTCYGQGPVLGEAMEGANDMYVLCGAADSGNVSATLYDCDNGDGTNSCGAAVCGAINPATGAGNVLAGATGFGEYTDTVTPECCGDDWGENYVTTDCDSNSVSLCCPDDKPYVKNGVCVPDCSWVCGDNSYDGTEYDDSQSHCDSVSDFKGTTQYCNIASTAWNLNGNASSGCAINSSDDPYLCCGDDAGEYNITYNSYTQSSCDPNSPSICCDQSTDCYNLFGSSCTDIHSYASDMGLVCEDNSTWQDCDSYYADCGASVCGSASGVYAGDASSFGGYTDTTTLECCGDDSGENYVSTDCGGNAVSLCCPDDKPYVDGGVCVASCPSGCGDNALAGSEGDSSESSCGTTGAAWNLASGDSPSTCWQSGRDDPYLCCGDDSDEYIAGECDPPNSVCGDTKHCCAQDNDCSLTNGTKACTPYGDTDIYLGLWTYLCHGGSHWDDCDDYYNECGAAVCGSASGVYAGELGSFSAPNNGKTYTDTTTLECCGDDTNEFYASLADGVSGDRKCCDSANDLVAGDGSCDTPPSINLSSPSDSSSCQDKTGITLSWTASDGDSQPNPLSYHVYFSTDQTLVTSHDASVLVATVSATSYDTGGLSYDTTYYWTVLADDGGLQTASEVWSFTTQACDANQACCQADGCGFIGDGGQPRGYTDSYSCSGNANCGGSCDIQGVDYYCQDNDSSVHQSSGPTGVTCDACEEWDNADGCNLCAGSECGANTSCSTSHCSDPIDPDGSGDADAQSYYQTRADSCNACQCPAWGAYESCQDSYNNCTGATRVECYQGTGCNTANNACYCETGYNPDGAGGCVSDGTYPIADFDWCLSAQNNTVQFTNQTTGGTLPYTNYAWNFGDSSCPAGSDCDDSDPLHTYSTTATYNVSLTVTDSAGRQGSTNQSVDLNATGKNCSTAFNFNSINAQSSTQLALNWDYSLGNGSYNIYRSDNGGSSYTQLSSPAYSCDISTCTYTDTGLNAGTQYYYYIVAASSNTYDSTTNPACTGGQGGPICPLSAYTKSDVSGLNVSSNSCGLINIQWDDLGEDYTYKLYRRADSAEAITASDLAATIDRSSCSGGKCSYNDDEIIPEQTYYYKITSYSSLTGDSALNDAPSGAASSYCFRGGSDWGEK